MCVYARTFFSFKITALSYIYFYLTLNSSYLISSPTQLYHCQLVNYLPTQKKEVNDNDSKVTIASFIRRPDRSGPSFLFLCRHHRSPNDRLRWAWPQIWQIKAPPQPFHLVPWLVALYKALQQRCGASENWLTVVIRQSRVSRFIRFSGQEQFLVK